MKTRLQVLKLHSEARHAELSDDISVIKLGVSIRRRCEYKDDRRNQGMWGSLYNRCTVKYYTNYLCSNVLDLILCDLLQTQFKEQKTMS